MGTRQAQYETTRAGSLDPKLGKACAYAFGESSDGKNSAA